MPRGERENWMKEFFSRFFGSGDRQVLAPEQEPPKEGASHATETQATEKEGDLPEDIELSSSTLTIADKLNTLKKTFEFESNLKDRLSEIRSMRELLLFVHDAFLFRFEKLREIGLISVESSSVLEGLNTKYASVLGGQPDQDGEGAVPDPQELLEENIELKERIENLHARYIKSGIVTDSELEKEQTIQYLQSRIREQHSKLRIAGQRLKALASYPEMVQTLRARLSLSNSKLEHQSKLLRSIVADNPRHQELIATVRRLNAENRKLKQEIERQSGLMQEIKRRLPPEVQPVVESLIQRNEHLLNDLDEKDQQLEVVGGGEEDLVHYIERLTEKNTQLKDMMNTKQSLDQFMKDQDAGKGGDSSKVIETLKLENQRLEERLLSKEAQIEAMAADPSQRQLMRAYSKLQSEYKQLFRESQTKENLFQQERNEKHTLMAQTRERTALIQENQRMKAQLDSSRRLAELVKKLEQQCMALKKERSELQVKNERTTMELEDAKRKIAKMSAEQNALMGEYQKLFENT